MVDNENQWEDMEYSDESGDVEEYGSEEYSDEEYLEEEYSDQDEYETYEEGEEYYEEDGEAPKKGNQIGCIIILLILLLVIGGVAFFFFSKGKGAETKTNTGVQNNVSVETSVAPDSTTALGDEFFAEAGGEAADMMTVDFSTPGETTVTTGQGEEEVVATVMDAPIEVPQPEQPIEVSAQEQTEEMVDDLFAQDLSQNADLGQGTSEIMVAYNKKARPNPFKPPVILKHSDLYSTIGGTEFEIIEPPTTSVSDDNLTKLLQTQISGILYDDVSPSAIVNLNGVDQFVKIGDTVAGYTIESITKDKVQITYKNNTYVASVGELFTRGALEKKRAVADLENKFAGRYRNNN